MTITPTALLSLPIITTGTESGTWGDVVDNGLTSYLDIAIAGGLAITITTADVTLTKTAGTNAVTNIGATTAQYAILNISGAKTAARNLNLPATSKSYIINNAGTGGFLLTVRGATPTTGVTLVDGEECIVAWTGTDFVKIASSVLTALSGTLGTANGGTGSTSTAYASLTANVSGTLPVGNGGTGAATLTANNVLLGNGTSAVQVVAPSTSGNVLTSNGTTWQSTASGQLQYALFASSGTWTCPTNVTRAKVTVIGGGGGGSNDTTGYPGGAGGYGFNYYTVTPATGYTITVGAGGTGSSGTATSGGTTSFASSISATGGGGGNTTSFGTAGTCANSLVNTVSGGSANISPPFIGSPSNNTAVTTPTVWAASTGRLPGAYGNSTNAGGMGGVGGAVFIEYIG